MKYSDYFISKDDIKYRVDITSSPVNDQYAQVYRLDVYPKWSDVAYDDDGEQPSVGAELTQYGFYYDYTGSELPKYKLAKIGIGSMKLNVSFEYADKSQPIIYFLCEDMGNGHEIIKSCDIDYKLDGIEVFPEYKGNGYKNQQLYIFTKDDNLIVTESARRFDYDYNTIDDITNTASLIQGTLSKDNYKLYSCITEQDFGLYDCVPGKSLYIPLDYNSSYVIDMGSQPTLPYSIIKSFDGDTVYEYIPECSSRFLTYDVSDEWNRQEIGEADSREIELWLSFPQDSVDMSKVRILEVEGIHTVDRNEKFLATEPVIISMEGDEENVFKPVKYREATINMLSSDIIKEFYSNGCQDVVVEIYEVEVEEGFDISEELLFRGYVSPETYNSDYASYYSEYELNVLDELAILQYIDYSTEERKYRTLTEVIRNILSKSCTAQALLYFPFLYSVESAPDQNTPNILDLLYVNETNFFDEEGVPMKCNEVLEEIGKFLGVSFVTSGRGIINAISYEALLYNKTPKYFRIALSGNAVASMLQHNEKDLSEILRMYVMDKDTNISILEPFNKITVTDDRYEIEEVFPDLFDDNYTRQIGLCPFEAHYTIPYTNGRYDVNGMREWNILKFYYNKNIRPCGTNKFCMSGNRLRRKYPYVFALMKVANNKYLDVNGSVNECWKLDYKEYLVIQKTTTQGEDEVFTFRATNPIFLTDKSNIIINMRMEWHALTGRNTEGKFTNESAVRNNLENWKCKYNDTYSVSTVKSNFPDVDEDGNGVYYLKAKLRMNGLYWTGSGWTGQLRTFNIPFKVTGNSTAEVQNTIPFWKNADDEGYSVYVEDQMWEYEGGLMGTPELTIYRPQNSSLSSIDIAAFISDFEVSFSSNDKGDEGDTEYSTSVDGDSVNEYPEISLKLNSNNGNKPVAYSDIIYLGRGVQGEYSAFYPLNTMKHYYTKKKLSPEEMCVYRYYKQYSLPTRIINTTIGYNCTEVNSFRYDGSVFATNAYEWNLENNTKTVQLIELHNDYN